VVVGLALASTGAASAGAAGSRELGEPKAYEAFFGRVAADVPPGATRAALYLGDRRIAAKTVAPGRVVFRAAVPPGRYDLRIRFTRGPKVLRRVESRRAWLLPGSAATARRGRVTDARLAAALARLGRSFSGNAALWVHDLATGRTAGWNAGARFPAASTVKLAVLIAGLRRFGPHPERSAAWGDLEDVAYWSSNRASNRLLVRLGGSEAGGTRIAQDVLDRIGARNSTFTGNYRLGTGVAEDAPDPPPFLAYRRTTARDLGRILFELHAAALGNGLAVRRTGLTPHLARVAVGLLLSSGGAGQNVGLLRPAVGRATPMAQKQGWTTSVRHTAAIVYSRRGPTIAVLLTYRSNIDASESNALGVRLVDLLDRPVGTVR
jgi:hypothetical protein